MPRPEPKIQPAMTSCVIASPHGSIFGIALQILELDAKRGSLAVCHLLGWCVLLTLTSRTAGRLWRRGLSLAIREKWGRGFGLMVLLRETSTPYKKTTPLPLHTASSFIPHPQQRIWRNQLGGTKSSNYDDLQRKMPLRPDRVDD